MEEILVDDRKRSDEEFAEERRRREEEMVVERERREREVEARMAEMREQMATLSRLVEARSGHGVSTGEKVVVGGELKVAKLTDQDDIEAYLVTFERVMEAYDVPNRWAYKLATQLSGRAQQAYTAMPSDVSGDYDEVKSAILR